MTDEKDPEETPSAIALSDNGPITTTELAIGLQEISRATDALVRRVTDGGGVKDRSEHQLDRAYAVHHEENTSGGQHSVRCDRCGLKSPGAGSVARAGIIAEQIGWYVSDEADHCPTCRDDRAKQLGVGQSDVDNDTLPPELSIPDQIFLTRLEWLLERFEAGATPVATLLNARRSGHRSMLSDLARSFDYDDSAFFQKVKSVLPLPNGWQVCPSEDSSEWNFFRKLFRLLKVEDGA